MEDVERELRKIFNREFIGNTCGSVKKKPASIKNFRRPAYSYTSICPNEKYRIKKAEKVVTKED